MLTPYSDPAGIIAALEARVSRGLDIAQNKRMIRAFRRLEQGEM